jgi:hypothetical protein
MTIQTSTIEPHWNYLLALDSDLAQLSRYIEFDARNFDCFSLEIARILLASASECDVVAKQLCEVVEPGCGAEKVNAYRDVIIRHLPQITDFEVIIPRYGLSLKPWDEWHQPNVVPLWWTANNKVKHERHKQFHQATLKNVLNAVGGLFILLLYLYRDKAREGELVPSPQIIRASSQHIEGVDAGSVDSGIWYKL